MITDPSHPPRPGIRRRIHETYIDTPERRREFAAIVRTINRCGMSAEITIDGVGPDPRITIYATRRVRTTKDES